MAAIDVRCDRRVQALLRPAAPPARVGEPRRSLRPPALRTRSSGHSAMSASRPGSARRSASSDATAPARARCLSCSAGSCADDGPRHALAGLRDDRVRRRASTRSSPAARTSFSAARSSDARGEMRASSTASSTSPVGAVPRHARQALLVGHVHAAGLRDRSTPEPDILLVDEVLAVGDAVQDDGACGGSRSSTARDDDDPGVARSWRGRAAVGSRDPLFSRRTRGGDGTGP